MHIDQRREIGRMGGLAANASGANQRAIAQNFAARAKEWDPSLTAEEAEKIGKLLRRQNLSTAGRMGVQRRWAAVRASRATQAAS